MNLFFFSGSFFIYFWLQLGFLAELQIFPQ